MKVTSWVLLAIVLVAGCSTADREEKQTTKYETTRIKVNEGIQMSYVTAKPFDYEGHRYILFEGFRDANGVEHDPNCPRCLYDKAPNDPSMPGLRGILGAIEEEQRQAKKNQ